MRFLIAQRRLALLGGSETFVLTIAEHLALLGHDVIVQATELGLAAELGRARAIRIVGPRDRLPRDLDATVSLDRAMAIDLARRYPHATRLYVMHNANEVWLPPPEPGIVAATLAPNDRLAILARGCAGAGEVVRMRQPIDLYRFSPRGRWPGAEPTRILLIGNYFDMPAQRVDQLQAAWSRPGLEWRRVGFPQTTTTVADEMAEADIVVGYGRSILEAMACGRPAYVHEHCGSDGWVTAESYERMEADGFSGIAVRPTPDLDALARDFQLYDPALGRVGHDFARRHDARLAAAELVALVDRLGRPRDRHDPRALKALHNLAQSKYRADLDVAGLRIQLRLEVLKRVDALDFSHIPARVMLSALSRRVGRRVLSKIAAPARWAKEKGGEMLKFWRHAVRRDRPA